MNKAEAIWNIDERVDGIYNDLKAFLYIRKNNLQHNGENIGGGNMTQAIALFSVLNFLGKIQYYLDKRTDLRLNEAEEPIIIEEQAFIHLVRMLDSLGIKLGLPADDSEVLKLVWNGFRNKLAHVSNVEFGKQVMVYVIGDPDNSLTISNMLKLIKDKEAFEHDGDNRNWRVNADILLAKLPSIKKAIVDQLHHDQNKPIDYNVLEQIIG